MSDDLSPDELEEELTKFEFEGATKIGISDFARLMNMKPQLVHYYIRTKVLETEYCNCGRKVLDIESARKALEEHQVAKSSNIRRAPDAETS